MESDNPAPQRSLLEAERAAAAPHLEYPSLPAWYPLAGGLWAGLLVVGIAGAASRSFASLVLIAVLITLEITFFRWYRRRRGVEPSLRHAPPELAAEMRRYFVGFAVIFGVVPLVYWLVGPVSAAVVAGALVAAGLQVYERRYTAAAEAVRRRLR